MTIIRMLVLTLVCTVLLPYAMADETQTTDEPVKTEAIEQSMGQAAPPVGKLIIEISGIKKIKGELRCRIYNSEENFPSKKEEEMFRLINVPVEAETATITVDNIPLGSYGIIIHHDRNSDGKMNKTWYRKPKEPVGCSRDARGSFGPPKWKDAFVELNQHELIVPISLK